MSVSAIRTVCVAGATGNIGVPITQALVASGLFTVSALTRSASFRSNAFSSLPETVEFLRADYTDHAALVSALRGQDAVVCCIDTVGNDSQEKLIDAAAEAGVKRFLPCHWAFDHLAEGFREVAPVWVLKEGPIERLRKKGVGWTAVITGSWIDFVSCAFPVLVLFGL
jgi:NAD(P)-dependent dehydrogenase (short-subunit alcohol dehydrogenase family)